MKLFFIGSSCYILYLMKMRYRSAAGHMLSIYTHTPIHSDLSSYVSDQHMTLPSTPSRLNISSLPASSFPSSSTTNLPFQKFCGHFPFGWKQWQFFLNCSCFNAQEKQKRSQRIIWLHWVHTELFTSLTGYTGMIILFVSLSTTHVGGFGETL
jgi:hypothetical protein